MVRSARLSGLCVGLWVVWSSVALAQTPAPPPSQVRPPIIIPPSGGGRIGNTDFLKIAQKLGASDVIAKPFDPDDFLTRVSRCLGEA